MEIAAIAFWLSSPNACDEGGRSGLFLWFAVLGNEPAVVLAEVEGGVELGLFHEEFPKTCLVLEGVAKSRAACPLRPTPLARHPSQRAHNSPAITRKSCAIKPTVALNQPLAEFSQRP
jgi:hypothetical protein